MTIAASDCCSTASTCIRSTSTIATSATISAAGSWCAKARSAISISAPATSKPTCRPTPRPQPTSCSTPPRARSAKGRSFGCTLQHTGKVDGGANIRFIGRSTKEPHKVGYFSISANHISDTQVNIHLVHARGISITGNTFGGGAQYDLSAEDCSQLVVGSNLFDRNPDYPKGTCGGLLLVDCCDCTFSGDQVFAAAQPDGALVLRRCNRMNLTGCTILDSDGCAILLDECSGVRVSDCLIRDDRPASAKPVALRVVGGRGNMVVNNLLRGSTEIPPGSTVVQGNYGGE